LGRTGERVSIIGLGGFHIGMMEEEDEAIEIIHRAIDLGITFFDNCWDYNDGESERRLGKALQGGRRDKVFLMTKIDGRNRRAAEAQIDQSLRRLRTDVVDLMQVHEVIRESDPERIFASGGTLEALLAARDAGKIRYIGFTGHKDPSLHLRMLELADSNGFSFDAVQMPLNVMDPHYRSFQELVLPRLVQQQTGVLGMKALGGGHLLESEAVTARECLRYALSLPTDVVITGIDSEATLGQAIEVARDFEPMSSDEIGELLERTRPHGRDGRFEKFKTTREFDATELNRHWLEEPSL
jgi:aryl-alcohol dehydrogenase-like predicted oxidoreductase